VNCLPIADLWVLGHNTGLRCSLFCPTGVMAEPMLRTLLKSKIHRARITRSDLDYEGSISLDEALVEAADFLPFEKVDIYNVTNGQRWQTYVIPVERDSGEVCINGAAARLCQPNDVVIICSYVQVDPKLDSKHRVTVISVDRDNRVSGTVEKSVPLRS
jgi:aspartate 1-decarboxylase